MLCLVMGEPKSGKSIVAEKLVCHTGQGRRLYIATMEPTDEAGIARVARHRGMRAGKGFDTLEYYRDFKSFIPPDGYGVALLECMTNLLANEMFSPQGAGANWRDSILTGISKLQSAVETIIIVTNEFSVENKDYDADTVQYIKNMNEINKELAGLADVVVSVSHGVPVWMKGGASCAF